MTNNDLALEGENLAVEYLKNKGYKIIARNWRFSRIGEIDIIAKFNNEIVFVEVKTRKSTACGDPAESVTRSKQKKIARLAEAYISQNVFNDQITYRFDVLTIIMKQKPDINHIENAYTT